MATSYVAGPDARGSGFCGFRMCLPCSCRMVDCRSFSSAQLPCILLPCPLACPAALLFYPLLYLPFSTFNCNVSAHFARCVLKFSVFKSCDLPQAPRPFPQPQSPAGKLGLNEKGKSTHNIIKLWQIMLGLKELPFA